MLQKLLTFTLSMALFTSVASAASILIVATNVDTIPGTTTPTGLWAEELVVPHHIFTKAGFTVDIASPAGGNVPVDAASVNPATVGEEMAAQVNGWLEHFGELLENTPKVSDLSADHYVAMFVAGGHGVMWDIATDEGLRNITIDFFDAGKAVASVCHGPAFLAQAKRTDGSYVIAGYKVTGFSNAEEAAIEMTEVVPFSLEDELQKASEGKYVAGKELFGSHAVVDRNLVTGQNPASSEAVAQKLLDVIASLQKAPKRINRAIIKCPVCKGTGVAHGGPGMYPYTCPKCKGKGYITNNQPPISTDH